MKTSIYKKDSWHYRIATSENMLIPNIFNQREEWNTTECCYEIQPPMTPVLTGELFFYPKILNMKTLFFRTGFSYSFTYKIFRYKYVYNFS